jgi:threonine dehydrogenase-like Zn-dependent dehydrogenase
MARRARAAELEQEGGAIATMKAVVFHGVNDIRVEDVPRPRPKAGEALIRITATTICGTDVHIVRVSIRCGQD